VLLGGLFVVAGALKPPDPAAAVRAVRAYHLLPEALVAPVAFGLPVLEIAVGLALIAGVFVRTAALSTAVLLAVFIAASPRPGPAACGSTAAASVTAARSRPVRPRTPPNSPAMSRSCCSPWRWPVGRARGWPPAARR
jgi:uncharacterized membrane protein YphA (DoxX/SURF4 family)